MRTLGNIIWHFPYFGWLRALLYAIGGLFWCITVIGIPLGIGLFQLSLFMLAPFSKGLVTHDELALLTGEEQDSFVKTWSFIIRILYFPFGLVAAFGTVVTIGIEFGTLVGIPCGLAEAKALATVFNPINKKCVPRAVAEEIERRKAGNTLNKYMKASYTPEEIKGSQEKADKKEVAEPVLSNGFLQKVQAKTDEELKTILKNRDDYNPQLVKAAERVLLDRITCVDTPTANDIEKKEIILEEPAISKSKFDDDKYKAYQPSSPSTYEERQEYSPAKTRDDSSKIVEDNSKWEGSESLQSKDASLPEVAKTEEGTTSPFTSQKTNNTVFLSILAGVVLAVGGTLGYLLWYIPYAKDRDAARMYVVADNVLFRSSGTADTESNIINTVPYGSQVLTYDVIGDWAQVKIDGQEGVVAAEYLLSTENFDLLNGAWGNSNVKDCIESTKCRLAILDFYKTNGMEGGLSGWQIYTNAKDVKPNSVYYPRLYDKNSKFTDFMFLVKNNQTEERRLVCYSFEDHTEKPIFRFYVDAPVEGDIEKMIPYHGAVRVVFDNYERLNIEL